MSTQAEADSRIVAQHVSALVEHFDTVQIFVTRHMPAEEDGTVAVQRGAGNWYARYGQISEWLKKEDEEFRKQVRPFEL